jgi:spermidine/putrescine transport system substrate-binding protein
MADPSTNQTPDRTSLAYRAALARGLVTRRSLMVGAAGLGAAAALSACGSSGKSSSGGSATTTPTAKAAADQSDTEKVVNWSNWTEYIDVSDDEKSRPTLDAFKKQTGIKVNYTEDYNDNDEFYAKVRPLLAAGQDTGRDIWCSTDWMVGRLIRQGYVQKLNMANIPNAKNLQDSLRNVEFDPGRLYSLPWQSGFAGIAYNLKATGGKKVETMTQLLTDPALKGKVTLLTEWRDTVGLVMLELGKDITKFSDADFQAAIDMIKKAKDAGQIKGFTGNDYTDGLDKGDIAACAAWTGDVVQLQFSNPKVDYTLPQAGFTLWSDNFVVPALAKHKKNAETLINYYYDPAVMSKVEDWVNYIPPVQGTKEALVKDDPDVANNQLIFPSEETLKRAHVFKGLSPAEDQKYSAMFADLTTG